MVRLNQMGNPVGYNARLAAARTRQQKERTFDMGNCVALWRIEAS